MGSSARAFVLTNVQSCITERHYHQQQKHSDFFCKVSCKRTRRIICSSSTDESISTATKISTQQQENEQQQQPSSATPFVGGKISSKITAAQKAQQQSTATASSAAADSSSLPNSNSFNAPQPSKAFNPTKVATPLPPTAANSKAFARPAISSPFENSGSSSSKGKRLNSSTTVKAPLQMSVADRIQASKKKFLSTVRQEARSSKGEKIGLGVPSDIFDEPKPSTDPNADKVTFMLGSDPLFLLISFGIIIAIMFATFFLVWKLGAIHYNEA